MRHTIIVALIGMMLLAFVSPASAKKPVDDNGIPFGNGFPSGEHFNLNIIAKKDNFNCPPTEIDPCTLEPIYGNVIFIPRVQGNDPITILMESGRKGSKKFPGLTVLQVTDWCSESFPNDGSPKGDSAVVQIPANENGYAVYARITGKPGDGPGDPNVTIDPNLVYVEDEAGNDLILLGLVGKDGGITKFASDSNTIYRTSIAPSTKGKGVQKAIDLTPLFEWSGEVCYVQEDSNLYCDDFDCTEYDLCCVDANDDGIYERCDPLDDVGIPDPCDPCAVVCPLKDINDVNYIPVTAQCVTYQDWWVFNIADFVGYLWDIDTTGAYVIQVRFYPL